MISRKLPITVVLTVGCLLALSTSEQAFSQEPPPPAQDLEKVFPKKPPYSPYAGRHFPERVYWGDTHLHTSFSMDAGAFGCRLGPRDAYRFAKGQEVIASSGQPARLARPLDFLVVADHSDGFGFFPLMMSGDPTILADPQGRRWYDMIRRGTRGGGSDRHRHIILVRGQSQRRFCQCPERPAIRVPGKRLSRQPKRPMTRAVSPLLLASNGPPTLEATIFTEIFSFATTEARPAWLSHTRLRSLWAATILGTCGSG